MPTSLPAKRPFSDFGNQVESGPGEFPTGPAITFAPDSDIAIREGQAAIEFRPYHAGKSIIRATSPGLKDATIEINSLGEPKFVTGKTLPVKPRPYIRFTGSTNSIAVTGFGRENPTRTSSEVTGHSGSLANDGKLATFWQAAEGDKSAWLCVDLERIVKVTQTKLTFPTAGNWRYRIEISDDGSSNWKTITDQSRSIDDEQVRNDIAATSASGRFLRVTFVALPIGQSAALAEVEAFGTVQ